MKKSHVENTTLVHGDIHHLRYAEFIKRMFVSPGPAKTLEILPECMEQPVCDITGIDKEALKLAIGIQDFFLRDLIDIKTDEDYLTKEERFKERCMTEIVYKSPDGKSLTIRDLFAGSKIKIDRRHTIFNLILSSKFRAKVNSAIKLVNNYYLSPLYTWYKDLDLTTLDVIYCDGLDVIGILDVFHSGLDYLTNQASYMQNYPNSSESLQDDFVKKHLANSPNAYINRQLESYLDDIKRIKADVRETLLKLNSFDKKYHNTLADKLGLANETLLLMAKLMEGGAPTHMYTGIEQSLWIREGWKYCNGGEVSKFMKNREGSWFTVLTNIVVNTIKAYDYRLTDIASTLGIRNVVVPERFFFRENGFNATKSKAMDMWTERSDVYALNSLRRSILLTTDKSSKLYEPALKAIYGMDVYKTLISVNSSLQRKEIATTMEIPGTRITLKEFMRQVRNTLMTATSNNRMKYDHGNQFNYSKFVSNIGGRVLELTNSFMGVNYEHGETMFMLSNMYGDINHLLEDAASNVYRLHAKRHMPIGYEGDSIPSIAVLLYHSVRHCMDFVQKHSESVLNRTKLNLQKFMDTKSADTTK